jgi:2-polyprenyl-3-methyl-5-hydroxy-6-metoxy-1,4-benzoquinol methylase
VSEAVYLTSCPGCGGADLISVFGRETARHNSLTRLASNTGEAAKHNDILRQFAQVGWTVCKHCALVFARRRPASAGCTDWYVPLFKLSEERSYDVFPLPPEFVEGKRKGQETLFRHLLDTGCIKDGAKILHIRCATGELLRLARQVKRAEVWGADFFPACVRHASAQLGESRVAEITGPEPDNPFAPRKFDLIISNHMITHSHDPGLLLRRYHDWLSEGGLLVVYNEIDHTPFLRSFSAYRRGINFFHKQLFTRVTFISLLRRCGFEPVHQDANMGSKSKLAKNMLMTFRKERPCFPARQDYRSSLRMMRAWQLRRQIAGFLRLTS